MGTNCDPLVADMSCDFMLFLSEDTQYEVLEAFHSFSRYQDDLLNIDPDFFDSVVNQIYPSELQLKTAWI